MQRNTKLTPQAAYIRPASWLFGFILAMVMAHPAFALSGGLGQASSTFTQIKTYLWVIIPIVCVIAGGILGVLYSLDIIRKDTFYQWCGGVVIAGIVAGGLVDLVFGTSI